MVKFDKAKTAAAFIIISALLLAVLVPGGSIDTRSFSHQSPIVLALFNTINTLLGLGSLALVFFMIKGINFDCIYANVIFRARIRPKEAAHKTCCSDRIGRFTGNGDCRFCNGSGYEVVLRKKAIQFLNTISNVLVLVPVLYSRMRVFQKDVLTLLVSLFHCCVFQSYFV